MFGEVVLAKMNHKRKEKGMVKKQKKKLSYRAVEGIWVGQVDRTGEHIVIKHSGNAVRCGTAKRVPKEFRWNPDRVLMVEATPRLPAPKASKQQTVMKPGPGPKTRQRSVRIEGCQVRQVPTRSQSREARL